MLYYKFFKPMLYCRFFVPMLYQQNHFNCIFKVDPVMNQIFLVFDFWG